MSDIMFFVSVALGIIGQGMDVITTDIALGNGWAEQNKLVNAAIKKIGFPAVAFIKVGGLAIGLPVLFYSLHQPIAGALVGIAAAGVGFYAGIHNYLLEKKAKI